MAVELANLQRRVPISPRRIGRTARQALRSLGRADALVNLTVVDDALIRRLNRRFGRHDRSTDVLAFPLDVPGPSRLWGEIVISAETAGRQARRLGIPVGLELDLLMVHGLLHLAGYDDREAEEARLMHQREREILEQTAAGVPARLWSGLLPG
jgi:probable rRNA maturation factor